MSNIKNEIKILLNLFDSAKFNILISKAKKLIKKAPEYLILYNILGSAYQNIGDLKLAKETFVKGYKIEPNNIAIMNNLANVYKNIGEIESSENLFKKIIEKKPDYINAHVNYGNLKRDNNDFEFAIDLYNKALKINPQIPVVLYSLALAYQGLGKFDLAIDYAKKTLEIEPKFTQADMLISQSKKYQTGDLHYEEMNFKINSLILNNEQKTNLLFSLAKAEEDMGLIEKSFNNLDIANSTRRKSLNFNINNETIFFNQLKNIFTKIDLSQKFTNNIEERKVIFILGMPRSGTSLVEQIITSHTSVFGAGELPQLSRIVKTELMINEALSEESIFNLVKNEDFANQLREGYYNYLKRFNSSKPFITDKAPLNFRWIGFIKILFPNSKIIHCSRSPKDNCLSIFKNFFEGGLDFGYNQKELGTYYNLYLDLMHFWEEQFPNTIYNAQYEKIIEDPENEIKDMIKFCNLNWEDNCLQFYNNKTPIKTMSTAQARKPIYKSSKNSFEKFAPYLSDLNKLI
ncbi:sulfotransferase [Candidatus Pelagibacter sp.]|nr:sulfotransferase [Candidatus Pelagibacter sp.]